ncbi:MAG: LON peptidase substrate-binding domain-containing protein [Clostridia bacterium]|nr:LON peptidase substrate-binding domain-containing protein [Clostridia bacterium]
MSYTERTKTFTMPIVPIRGTVVFPSVPVNLEITSSKTASVIGNLNDDDNMIFIVAQRDVDSEWSGNAKDLYSIGTVSKINKITRNSDGSMNLLAEGICRGELTGITKASPYYADVICRNFEYDSSSLKIQALVGEVLALFEQYIKNLPNIAKDIEKHVRTCSNPAKLADIIAATLLLKFDDKQDILEEYEPVRRLELLIFKMQKELELFSQELEIHKKVRARIDDNQREYYMREQLKVLKEELGEDSDDSEFHQYANRIIEANFPEEIEAKLIKEAEKLDRLPYGAAERTVLL